MKTKKSKSNWLSIIAVFFGFFIMGFVDIVGIATNFIKNDFNLSSTLANVIPMMTFLWFAVFSIPVGILMGKIGRKQTVLLSLILTTAAMLIPYIFYDYIMVLIAFGLLGISNTILQVSLNPLVASLFEKDKTASILTLGQFVKAISSFLGPIIVGFAASYFSNWKMIFMIYSSMAFLSTLLLFFSKTNEKGFENTPTNFRNVINLLGNKYILYCFFCILLIVGIDVGINTNVPELLMKRTSLELNRAGLGISIYFAARIIGTFFGAFMLLKISPLNYLKISLLIAMATFFLLMFISNLWILMALIFIIGFTCANVFSIIFSYALKESPTRSNEVSALMIMGVSGGAIILPLQGIINDHLGFFTSLFILFICLVLIFIFTLKLDKNVQE
ncbi:MFS transporter [Anaerorudis cellulosivorans]|uniref:MFS transporter n=1 Tax=Anaerorudis cellulosivorans TaxID=3397862 RepID=UPI0022202C36|nr:MFS transporter [Seramator thermalis]MCW1735990.1 MFS transporter [Seramator thermalis]